MDKPNIEDRSQDLSRGRLPYYRPMYNSYPMGCAIDIYHQIPTQMHVKKMYFYCAMCLNVLIALVLFSASCIKSIFNIATFRN